MGFVQYRTGGEYHLNSPEMAKALHAAVEAGPGYDHFSTYKTLLENRPVTALRDLLELRPAPAPLPLDWRALTRGPRGAGHRHEPHRRQEQQR